MEVPNDPLDLNDDRGLVTDRLLAKRAIGRVHFFGLASMMRLGGSRGRSEQSGWNGTPFT